MNRREGGKMGKEIGIGRERGGMDGGRDERGKRGRDGREGWMEVGMDGARERRLDGREGWMGGRDEREGVNSYEWEGGKMREEIGKGR